MSRYAEIRDGVAVTIVETAEGFTIEEMFSPEFVATLVKAPARVAPGWLYDGSSFSEPPPAPEPEPTPVVIPAGVFFDRLTEDEADQLDEAMMAKSVKFRRAWQAATEFVEASDLWPVMRAEMVGLFGEERTAELLSAA